MSNAIVIYLWGGGPRPLPSGTGEPLSGLWLVAVSVVLSDKRGFGVLPCEVAVRTAPHANSISADTLSHTPHHIESYYV
eukprot:5460082-Amphidinium_carterae.1